MKVVITGGHVAPALAVIERLPKNVEVVFVGRKYTFEGDTSVSFEYEEITKRGISFIHLETGRLQRTITKHTLPSLLRLPKGVVAARNILSDNSAQIVLSFGGYIGLPLVVAAATLGVPSVIHEQTMRAGFSNKISSRFAKKICLSWEASRQFFPADKIVLTGNPLREEILAAVRKRKTSELPQVYVTGGSGGSHALNMLVYTHLPALLERAVVVHQTGDATGFGDYDKLIAMQKSLPDTLQNRYRVVKFLSSADAASTMVSSDLVVGRSGMNTISEIIYFEKPALCIPLPVGQRGEQEENATLLSSLGLGRILHQEKASELFVFQIMEMLGSLSSFRLTDHSYKLRFEHAADQILAVLYDVANATKTKSQ